MAANTSAQSSALRVIGPILSIVYASAIAPERGTRPKVGRRPERPHTVEGDVMEPFVSVPMPNATQPAAVAEPGPADDPLEPLAPVANPVVGPGSHGLRVRSPYQTSPCASAPRVSLAMRIAPASSRRFTTAAS